MPRGKKLPREVVEQWPDVLEDVELEVVPVEYLSSIRITFDDGKVWEVDCYNNPEEIDIQDALEGILDEYEDEVVNVDFRLDTEKVKNDIKKRTAHFLKKRK